jgi:signal peptidase II
MVPRRAEEIGILGLSRENRLGMVFIAVTCMFLVLDQWGKGWAFAAGRQSPELREILPGLFAGAQGRNNGGMLSLEGTGSATIVWTFTAIVFILLAMALRWAIVLDRDRWRLIDAAAGGLLLGGILGNQLDRLRLGYVRDYIVLASSPFHIFNTADVFMILGAVMLVESLLANRRILPTRERSFHAEA